MVLDDGEQDYLVLKGDLDFGLEDLEGKEVDLIVDLIFSLAKINIYLYILYKYFSISFYLILDLN